MLGATTVVVFEVVAWIFQRMHRLICHLPPRLSTPMRRETCGVDKRGGHFWPLTMTAEHFHVFFPPCTRFAHDFNICRTYVTDGAGHLRYSGPDACMNRCLACLRARALHMRDHNRWRLAQVRRCRAPRRKAYEPERRQPRSLSRADRYPLGNPPVC